MSVTTSHLRNWQRIGQRGVYGTTLHELAQTNNGLFAISADLGNSSGLDRFARDLPDRSLNIGISEQHMVGFASGLSTIGYNVFISSFAPFICLRAGEQVRMNLSYMKSNVKIVSIGSGVSMGYLGNSHFGLEDISIIRSLPNIPIFQPSDCFELHQILKYLADFDGPAYLRLTGIAPNPSVFSTEYEFRPAAIVTHRTGSDLLVLATGSVVSIALNAIASLPDASIRFCSLPSVWPLPNELPELISSFRNVLVIDEHSLVGGLSSIVAESLCGLDTSLLSRLISVSLPASYLTSGSYEHLLNFYGFSSNSLADKMVSLLP
jgi:transketolase